MSKIGQKPIDIPENVTVSVNGYQVIVKGPKAELNVSFKPGITVEVKDNQVLVNRKNNVKAIKAMHGTIRSLIQNAINGTIKEYQKTLELVGTGYRATLQGEKINISLGYSHACEVEKIDGIKFEIEDQTKIKVIGSDKQLVGQTAANIRALKPPEPYKGKGIKYIDEIIIKKQGKAAAKAE